MYTLTLIYTNYNINLYTPEGAIFREVVGMVRRDGAFIKTERVRRIGKEIAKHSPKAMSLDRLMAWVEMEIGLTRKRAEEYILLACLAHGWVIEDGMVVFE